jgi:hypothetical protein
MKQRLRIRVLRLLVLALTCIGVGAQAQDAGQGSALGDVARKSRNERQSKDHVASKHVLNEETELAHGEIWTASACRTIPCAELSIRLPPGAKHTFSFFTQIPEVRVERGGKTYLLNVFSANQLPAQDLDSAKQVVLLNWFTRPYFFGTAAKIDFDEATKIDQWPAVLTHFTIPGRATNYRGLALFVAVTSGTFGFACIFPDLDSGDSMNICEEILNSAKVKMPEKFKYFTPPSYMNSDP